MINALYEKFPDSITADGKNYGISTNFRDWLKFSDMISDENLTAEEKILLIPEWLESPPKYITESIIKAVFDFYNCRELSPVKEENTDGEEAENCIKQPVFDWKYDAVYVIGDFRRYYNLNILRVENMHWWEFISLFWALPDDSVCQKRIAYRNVDISQIKGDSERKRILRIKQAIALPFELGDEDIGAVFGGV